jgi:outer membrane protein assembly factor BamB
VAAIAIVIALVAFNGGGDDDPTGDTAGPGQTTSLPRAEGEPSGGEEGSGDADGARYSWQTSLSEETTGNVTALDAERVYIVDDRGQVTAFDLANGGQTWTVDLGDSSTGTNPVRVGDVLLVGISEPSATFALDPATGQQLWKATDVWMDDPLVVGDLVLSHIGSTVTALDLGTGQIAWQIDSELFAWGNMAAIGDLVVTGSDGGQVQAIRPADGSVVWTTELPRGDVYVEAIATIGEVVVAVDDDQYVTALDAATGTQRWSKDMAANYFEEPVAVGDKLVVSTDTGLNIVDPTTGQILFNVDGSGSVATLAPGDVPAVLVTALDSLSAVDLEGNVLWTTDLPIDALEVEATDGYAVVTDFEGNMAVFTLAA